MHKLYIDVSRFSDNFVLRIRITFIEPMRIIRAYKSGRTLDICLRLSLILLYVYLYINVYMYT